MQCLLCVIFDIGVPHLREDEVPPAGGKPGWAAPPNPRMGPWLRLLKAIAESHNLTPEFEVAEFYSFQLSLLIKLLEF